MVGVTKIWINSTVLVTGIALVSCVPAHLKKYQRDGNSEPVSSVPRSGSKTAKVSKARSAASQPTIYAVDEHTFRFQVPSDQVWDSVINVLIKNYNLTIVDKDSKIITTDWDTFYLHNQVYRNKVSVRINRLSRGTSDVLVHNSVERLQDGSLAGAVGVAWLPAEDQASESHRIIRNMAILLNQPPPSLPASRVANGDLTPGEKGSY